jgi:hypothetical protein
MQNKYFIYQTYAQNILVNFILILQVIIIANEVNYHRKI